MGGGALHFTHAIGDNGEQWEWQDDDWSSVSSYETIEDVRTQRTATEATETPVPTLSNIPAGTAGHVTRSAPLSNSQHTSDPLATELDEHASVISESSRMPPQSFDAELDQIYPSLPDSDDPEPVPSVTADITSMNTNLAADVMSFDHTEENTTSLVNLAGVDGPCTETCSIASNFTGADHVETAENPMLVPTPPNNGNDQQTVPGHLYPILIDVDKNLQEVQQATAQLSRSTIDDIVSLADDEPNSTTSGDEGQQQAAALFHTSGDESTAAYYSNEDDDPTVMAGSETMPLLIGPTMQTSMGASQTSSSGLFESFTTVLRRQFSPTNSSTPAAGTVTADGAATASGEELSNTASGDEQQPILTTATVAAEASPQEVSTDAEQRPGLQEEEAPPSPMSRTSSVSTADTEVQDACSGCASRDVSSACMTWCGHFYCKTCLPQCLDIGNNRCLVCMEPLDLFTNVYYPGDEIVVKYGMRKHHGIYLGDGLVCHFSEGAASGPSGMPCAAASNTLRGSVRVRQHGRTETVSGATVRVDALYVFASQSGITNVREHSIRVTERSLPLRPMPEETLDRARSQIGTTFGEKGFNHLTNNCEHFTSWCLTGSRSSAQVENAARDGALAGVSGAVGFAALGVAGAAACAIGYLAARELIDQHQHTRSTRRTSAPGRSTQQDDEMFAPPRPCGPRGATYGRPSAPTVMHYRCSAGPRGASYQYQHRNSAPAGTRTSQTSAARAAAVEAARRRAEASGSGTSTPHNHRYIRQRTRHSQRQHAGWQSRTWD
eukprot:Clim_evm9s26 gene=Clim_evmTU9s26